MAHKSLEHNTDTPDQSSVITTVFCDWFLEEREESSRSRNRVLDNLAESRRCLELDHDDPANTRARKALSHISRLQNWMRMPEWALARKWNEWDYLTARVLFGTMMRASGAYKEQISLQATDQEDYHRRKQRPEALGVDIGAVVGQYLGWRRADHLPLMPRDVYGAAENASTHEIQALQFVYDHGHGLRDAGQESSESVTQLQGVQRSWLQAALGVTLFAASARDGLLEFVPMLEPKSITDEPQVQLRFDSVMRGTTYEQSPTMKLAAFIESG